MVATDLLRLAWEAEHDGRRKLRDSLLTLAVLESSPEDHWAERCRARLVLDRPDHYLGQFPNVPQALEDPRVLGARDRLRVKFPPAKVRSLLLKASTRRGPYLGRVESLEAMVDDLAGPAAEAENVRRDAPQLSRGPIARQKAARPVAWSIAYPPMSERVGPDEPWSPEPPSDWDRPAGDPAEDIALYYATVLLAIAILLATVQQASIDPNSPR